MIVEHTEGQHCDACDTFGCRTSANQWDRGYNPTIFGAKIYLNGAELDRCITSDMKEGFAIYYLADYDGNILIDEAKQVGKTAVVRGKITIDLPEGFDPMQTGAVKGLEEVG